MPEGSALMVLQVMVLGVPLASNWKVWPAVPTVKLVMLAVVMAALSLTVSEKLWVTEPEVLLALNTITWVPPVPAAGVPEMTPVVAFRTRLLGKEPESMVKVGPGNPLAASVKLPAVPTAKVLAVALVNTGALPTVSVKFCVESLPTLLLAFTTNA